MSNKKEQFVYPNAMLRASRTKFPFRSTHKTTMRHGGLYPIQVIECMPGDTFDLNIASLIRMSNPIVPIMSNIEMHVAAYFIPWRLIFPEYEQFEGVNKTGSWYNSNNADVELPIIKNLGPYQQGNFLQNTEPESLLSYLGVSYGANYGYQGPQQDLTADKIAILPNALSVRAYHRVWDEHYRNANVTAPIFNAQSMLLGYNCGITTSSSQADCEVLFDSNNNSLGIHKVCKLPDVYTKSLPAPQRGPSVEFLPELINVGGILTQSSGDLPNDAVHIDSPSGVVAAGDFLNLVSSNDEVPIVASFAGISRTINDLRLMFQIQKYEEKDARYGLKDLNDKYLGHFGVRSPDATIQKTQYLGEVNFHINIEQVLSTAGAADDSSSKLGQPGANSVTAGKGDLGVVSICERGYIMIVAAARHERTYSNGMAPYLLHHKLYDLYDPLFANIGEMPVKRILLGDVQNGTDVFGYQEPFWEYRFELDRVSGWLNPSVQNSLDYWTLADDFSSGAPLLNNKFIYEDRTNIARALVTGSNGPDYICDFYFAHTAVREMPLFGIPGLVDHH